MRSFEHEIASLKEEIAQLKVWKESALEQLNSVKLQDVGKELDVPLGVSVPSQILPGIIKLKIEKRLAKEKIDRIKVADVYGALIRADQALEMLNVGPKAPVRVNVRSAADTILALTTG